MSITSPLIKKFSTAKSKKMLIILKENTLIYDTYYKKGTIFTAMGWKQISDKQFLIIQKGFSEIIVDFATFSQKIDIL